MDKTNTVKETVTIPKHIYDNLIENAAWRIEDTQSGIDEGIYDADDENNDVLLADMREAVGTPPLKRGNQVYNLTTPDNFALSTISGFEVHPCIEENENVHQCTGDEVPDFWSVYVRYSPDHYTPGSPQGGLDCIADADTQAEAEALKTLLEHLVSSYRPE